MYPVLTMMLILAVQGGLIVSGLILRTAGMRLRELDRYPDPKRLADRLLIGGIVYLIAGCVFAALSVVTGLFMLWFILNGAALIAGSAGLLLATQSAFRRDEQDAGPGRRRLANWLRLSGTALCLTPLAAFPTSLFLVLIVFGVLGAVAAVHVTAARRRMDHNTVLWALAGAGQSELPLADALYATAQGLTMWQRWKTLKLARLLNAGYSLDEALQQTPGVIPHFAVLAAQVGARNGTLSKSLRIAAARHSGRDTSLATGTRSPLLLSIYIVVVPLIALFIVFGLMKWIVPKYFEIFSGFGSELPPLTDALIEYSDWFGMYWYLFGPVFQVLIVAALWLEFAYCRGWGENNIPLIGRLFRRLDVPDLLRNLAATAAAEQPFDRTLEVLSENHRRTAMRRALTRAVRQIRNGQNCWSALHAAGLLTHGELAVAESAGRAGNLPWALEQLADTIARRQSYRWLSIFEFVQPAIVVTIAAGVIVICLAFFQPLVRLINDLT